MDEYKGYYRNYVKNCNIIGGYRYSVKKLERSYGIYVPDSGYLYFARLDGINLYNLSMIESFVSHVVSLILAPMSSRYSPTKLSKAISISDLALRSCSRSQH